MIYYPDPSEEDRMSRQFKTVLWYCAWIAAGGLMGVAYFLLRGGHR